MFSLDSVSLFLFCRFMFIVFSRLFIYLFLYFRLQFTLLRWCCCIHKRLWTILLLRVSIITSTNKHTHTHRSLRFYSIPFNFCDFYIHFTRVGMFWVRRCLLDICSSRSGLYLVCSAEHRGNDKHFVWNTQKKEDELFIPLEP